MGELIVLFVDLHKLIEHDHSTSGSSSWYTGISSPSATSGTVYIFAEIFYIPDCFFVWAAFMSSDAELKPVHNIIVESHRT